MTWIKVLYQQIRNNYNNKKNIKFNFENNLWYYGLYDKVEHLFKVLLYSILLIFPEITTI